MHEDKNKKLIRERIDKKINEELRQSYDTALPYILLLPVFCLILSFFIDLPIYYYLYFSWHLVLQTILFFIYKKIDMGTRTAIILIKYFISGMFMFYFEDYTLFAVCDLFLFTIILNFSIKGKKAYIVDFVLYLLMLLKIYFVSAGYLYSYMQFTYQWVVTYLILAAVIILSVIIFSFIRHFLMENISEVERNAFELNRLAYYDGLTGTRNREFFIKEINERIKSGIKNSFLLNFNIKNIHSINLAYGTKIGDEVLKLIANTLHEIKLEDEIVARINGNEFGMYINSFNGKSRVEEIYYSLREKARIENLESEIEYYVACVEYDEEFKNVEEWLQKLIITTLHLKNNKIDGIGYYKKELGNSVLKKEKLYDELRKEIENDGFFLYYQCKVDASNAKIIGVEALARWDSKSFGRVSPYEFVPMVERLTLSNDFGDIIIRKAVSEYSDIEKKYGKGISLSINISPSHLLSADFKENIVAVLDEYGVSPKNIILEVTEDVMIEKINVVNSVFESLREVGFKISLDDFGTGYSSLNYLFELSIDELKIDKTFVDSLTVSKRSEELLNFLIDLSNMYDLDIVCEGVETDEQCEKLLELGCPIIQGYYFSKPAPLREE